MNCYFIVAFLFIWLVVSIFSSPAPSEADSFSITFGAHIQLGSDFPRPKIFQIRAMNIKATEFWLYIPQYVDSKTGRLNASKLLNDINSISMKTGGLKVYVHLMTNDSSGQIIPMPDLNSYREQLIQIVTALKGKVRQYSIENEISSITWGGTPEDYGALLSASYQTIKQVDEDAIVLDSGMAGLSYGILISKSLFDEGKIEEAINFINGFYQYHSGHLREFLPIQSEADLVALFNNPVIANILTYSEARFTSYCNSYDTFQIHYYQPWSYLSQTLEWILGQMEVHHCSKPLQWWEAGYMLDSGLPYDPVDHANAVVKLLTIAASKEVGVIIYFPYFEKGAFAKGLFNNDGTSRPAATAYQLAATKLSNFDGVENLSNANGDWIYRFEKNTGNVYVVWSTHEHTISLPINAKTIRVTDIDGKITRGDPQAIPIGISPIFVEPWQ